VIAIVLLAVAILEIYVGALLVMQYKVTSKLVVRYPSPPPPPSELKLKVYQDAECTVALTEIDWGTLEPGDSENFFAYVKNLGDVPFTMTLSTENWDPTEAATYMTLSWDYANQTIQIDEVLPVTFTLTVHEEAEEGNFSFDIVITAEG